MIYEVNETHDQTLKSWIESANDPNTDFPLQNLPYCMFSMKTFADFVSQFMESFKGIKESGIEGAIDYVRNIVKGAKSPGEVLKELGATMEEGESLEFLKNLDPSDMKTGLEKIIGLKMYQRGIGIAIGDRIFDLHGYLAEGHMDEVLSPLFSSKKVPEDPFLRETHISRELFGSGKLRQKVRRELQTLLSENTEKEIQAKLRPFLLPISELVFLPPFEIKNYTDFYCSIYHATNVGKLFRPDNPLLENYKYIPIGYHGRASSIVMSGTDFKRPKGQNRSDAEKPPVYIPSKALDYEMEVGFFVGRGTQLGETIALRDAEHHISGLCLVNDWSARDLQGWEYQPLGPFLGKSFATTISPFVVSMEALAPFRRPAFERGKGDPKPLDYLSDGQNDEMGGIDIKLDVFIRSKKMRDQNTEPYLLSRSNLKDLYWTIGQMLTHHASNGCNLEFGDLMATGTVSGKEDSERGCLLEITKRGSEPVELPSGETRKFLEDYDEIIMKGFCEGDGFRRIGFGECRGMVLPADD